MNPTQSVFGVWSGGRFMSFGENVGEERFVGLVRHCYAKGIRSFMTADVYGCGAADSILGRALAEFPRESYCLIGAVGHDFYKGERVDEAYPRFTDPELRGPGEYASYLRMAVDKSLERLGSDRFDLLFLHNPDYTGYTHEGVWRALEQIREEGKTELLGLAPGPANGFTLDVIHCLERYGSLIDWAMLILNPLEPWPAKMALPAAAKHGVKVVTRVVDYGGVFLGGIKPGAKLSRHDHRSFRPAGWVEAAQPKVERFEQFARQHKMNLFQLACRWCLGQEAVEAVVPTLIQEAGPDAKPVEVLAEELAELAKTQPLPKEVLEEMERLGDNRNCMALKGGNPSYTGRPIGDQWPLTDVLAETAKRWNVNPDRDLTCADDPRDIREKGAPVMGAPQASNRRLYLQLQAFGGCADPDALVKPLDKSGLEYVLYRDLNDPSGVAVVFIVEDPDLLATQARAALSSEPFLKLNHKPSLTMIGRTYSAGREPDLLDWLLVKPRRNALNPEYPWAVWYPLRRKPEFNRLPAAEQGKMLFEHAMIGRTYGKCGYAQDIRLACHGLDVNDNEFVIGLVGPELFPLSRLVQEMRKTKQTSEYMESLGPFFVGRVHKQSAVKD
ncbi:MAG: chlorite dismutase family protein [Planctomycetota bacterium]|nr:chlorite dismutase family protein [Planctomycetota bacterium]